MYAFGVTAWEIFSGHVPYDTEHKIYGQLETRDVELRIADHPDLRPDLDLVDERIRPFLQATQFFGTLLPLFDFVAAALLAARSREAANCRRGVRRTQGIFT